MKPFKITGIFLLIFGIAIIVFSLVSSYNVFNGKNQAPEIFKSAPVEISNQESSVFFGIEKEVEKMIGEQLKDFLPPDSLIGLLNLIAYSILAFILIFGGSQISFIGIKLIKND